MTFRTAVSGVLAMFLMVMSSLPGQAQGPFGSTPFLINNRACSIVGSEDVRRLSVAIGVATSSADAQRRLFDRLSLSRRIMDQLRTQAEGCAETISENFCDGGNFAAMSEAIKTTMPSNIFQSAFFTVVGGIEPTDDEAGQAAAAKVIGGTIGAIGGAAIGGDAAWTIGGGLVGAGAGAWWTSQQAAEGCVQVQTKYTALTEQLISDGVRPWDKDTRFYGHITDIAAQLPEEDRVLANAMVAAMAMTVKRMEQ